MPEPRLAGADPSAAEAAAAEAAAAEAAAAEKGMRILAVGSRMKAKFAERLALRQAKLMEELGKKTSPLAEFFHMWDADANGCIDLEEFRRAVTAVGLPDDPEATQALFNEFDTDGSGMLEYKEFLRYSLKQTLRESSMRVMDLFKQIDKDSKGTIDLEEFIVGIAELGFEAPRDDLEELFKEWDKNGNGEVDFKEMNSQMRQTVSSKPKMQKKASALLERGKLKAKEDLAEKKEDLAAQLARIPSLARVTLAAEDEVPDDAPAKDPKVAKLHKALRKQLFQHFPYDVFVSWDTDCSGTISKAELSKAVIEHMKVKVDASVCDGLFDFFDRDGSGILDYQELYRLLAKEQNQKPNPKFLMERKAAGATPGQKQ